MSSALFTPPRLADRPFLKLDNAGFRDGEHSVKRRSRKR
jgi:hypothetical protein